MLHRAEKASARSFCGAHGFLNKKRDEDFLVKVHSGAGRTYHPRDFKLRAEPIDASPNRWHQYHGRSGSSSRSDESPSTGSQVLSQSERDWTYAKRALARGEAPEDVIRNIAEFRAYDKHDPLDYAVRTVTKAQADLQNSLTHRNSGTLAGVKTDDGRALDR